MKDIYKTILFGFSLGVILFAITSTKNIWSVSVGTIHNFSSGIIKSQEFNENFQNLKTAVESIGEAPIGTIVAFASETPPSGWFICDGSTKSRTTYANLYAVIGIQFGVGDGSNTFHLPDLRGRFLRGWDNKAEYTRDLDYTSRISMNPGGAVGGNIGSLQGDEFKEHSHGLKRINYNISSCSFFCLSSLSSYYNSTSDEFTEYSGGLESRPKNVTLNYIIKY